MNSRQVRNILFALVVAAYLYYAYQYIQSTRFTIGDKTYYILFDDAMISMRYAYNLAHGHGLVWNPGERVEGFTNPLWVAFMAIFHLFPIPPERMSLYIQLSGMVFLTANLFFVRKIMEVLSESPLVMLAAVALTAFYTPLNSWGLLGMEVSLLTLIVSLVTWLVLSSRPEKFTPLPYVLLACSTLVRVDMAVVYVVMMAVLAFFDQKHRTRHLVWGLSLLALFLGGQTLARFLYYGQLLPNTYYLKVENWPFSLRILRGLYALFQFVWYSNWVLMLLPFALFLFRRDWKIILLFLLILGQIAYSVYVGGDAWEHRGGSNRFISISIPLFFVLFALMCEKLRQLSVTTLARGGLLPKTISHVSLLLLLTFAMLNFNALIGEWKSIERWALARRPTFTAGNEHYVTIARNLQKIAKPDATIAVTAAGSIPYFLPDNYFIDILGKADPVIAHGPVKTPMSIQDVPFMQPGHMKWDYSYTIGELQPDIVVELRADTYAEAEPYLQGKYVTGTAGDKLYFYLLEDSPNINWDQVQVKN